MRQMLAWLTGSILLLGVGCGDDDGTMVDAGRDGGAPVDAGPPADAGARDAGAQCILDEECDDGVYCNGREDCDPIDTRADDFGCVPGNDPCVDGLICTVEETPACNEDTRTCNDVTYDHSLCPMGTFCVAFAGCSMVTECPSDGSACADEDDEPCIAPICDTELTPALCIPTNIADDTPCMDGTGASGICRRGRCCTDC